MVVKKYEENIKGVALIKSGKKFGDSEGKFEFEIKILGDVESPKRNRFYTLRGFPTEIVTEERAGRFDIYNEERMLSILNYNFFLDFTNDANLMMIGENGVDLIHYFKNNQYIHTEIGPTSTYLKQIVAPKGMSLIQIPDLESYLKDRLEISSDPSFTSRYDREEELKNDFFRQRDLVSSINVTLDDLTTLIPENIKSELNQATERYPLIEELIGNYI